MCCPYEQCIKWVLCIINTLIALSGVLLAVMGFFGSKLNSYLTSGVMPSTTNTLLIAVGICMAIVAVGGCAAGFLTSKLLLRIYSCLVVLVGIFLIGLSIYGLTKGIKVIEKSLGERTKELHKFNQAYNISKTAKEKMDKVQRSFTCCGVDKAADWKGLYEYPPSCCAKENVRNSRCHPDDIYKKGCKENLQKGFHKTFKIIFGVMILFAIFCGVGAAVAMNISSNTGE